MGFIVKAVKSVVGVFVDVVKGVFSAIGVVLGFSKPKGNAENGATGRRLSKRLEPEDFRKIVFGKTAFAVDLRYWEVHGAKNDQYSEVIAAASHRVHSFGNFYIEEEPVSFSGNNATGTYAGVLTRRTHDGSAGSALPVGSGAYWSAASKFTGVAHYALAWNTADDKKLPNGVPSRYTQEGEGALVYDPRRDSTRGGSGTHRANDQSTWEYAPLDSNGQPIGRNNALQMLWYLLGWRIQSPQTGEWHLVAGRGVDPNDINWPDMIAAANDAEALQLYTDCILSTGDDHERNESIISCDGLAGELLDPGGLWTYKVTRDDTADVAVVLTEDDIAEGDVKWDPQAPLSELFNEVAGTYIDPSATSLYQAKAYPTVKDAAYAAADGYKKRASHNFQNVQDPALAQRLARIKLNRTRFTGEFSATFNMRALKAQVWSIVQLASDRWGMENKLFRVMGQSISDAGIELLLREEDPSIYAGGTVTIPAAPSSLPKYNTRQKVALTGIAVYPISVTGTGGTVVSGLRVSWDAVPGNVRRVEVEFKPNAAGGAWTSAGVKGPLSTDATVDIAPLVGGVSHSVRLRTWTIHEVPGDWQEVSATTSTSTIAWDDVTGPNAPEDRATSNRDSIYDPFDYANITELRAAWNGLNYFAASEYDMQPGVDSPGGSRAEFGNNSGNDMAMGVYHRGIPFDPEDLYEVSFDLEFLACDPAAVAYLGVACLDASGVNIATDAGTFAYTAAAFFSQSGAGRRTLKGYFRGRAATGVGNSVGVQANDPANPGKLPLGTVEVRPVFIVNYLNKPGAVRMHQAWLRKVNDVTVLPTGPWSSTRTYARHEGVTYQGRSFASKDDGNLNHAPPSTAADDAYWFLVADKGTDGTNGISPPLVTLDATKTVAAYDKNDAYLGGGITFTAARQNSAATIYWQVFRVSDGAGIYGGFASDFYGNYPTYFSTSSHDVLSMTEAGVAAYINAYGAFRVVASAYGQPASDSVTINKVKDGADGANGAPGGPGADGSSSYVHHAYADNITGTVNFTTGDPGGRAFQGVYIDNVAADSTNPASYAWSAYTGPASFGLYPAANVVVGPDFIHKSSGAAGWNASAYSTEAFVGGCSASFVAGNDNVMFGINTDPAANNDYDSIDYALYLAPGGSLDRYESNSGVAIGTWAAGDTIQVHYDGKVVRYYKNGTVLDTRTAAHGVPQGARFFLDTSIYSVGSRIEKIKWNAAGQSGADGAAGVSPVAVSVSPASDSIRLDASGAAKSGELPLVFNVKATKGGAPIAITSITINASSGGTWTEDDVAVRLTALAGGAKAGEATFTVVAGGETLTGNLVSFSTSEDGASATQTSRTHQCTYAEANSTSPAQAGPTLAYNAKADGSLVVNMTGTIRPLSEGYQFTGSLQYSTNGGSSWTTVTGSTQDSNISENLNPEGTANYSACNVNGTGPYTLTGLGANAAVLVRRMINRKAGAAATAATPTGGITLFMDAT